MIEELIATALENILPGKVFPQVAPPDTKAPYLTYQLISARTADTLECTAETYNNIQIDCYAEELLTAKQIIQSARGQLAPLHPGELTEFTGYEYETRLRRATLELTIIA